ncbi:MAG: hypothetical protein ABW190_13295 [Rhizobacter sp.]
MATFKFFGHSVDLPATELATRAQSTDDSAWLFGQFVTVQLLKPMEALRVHTNGKAYPDRPASAEAGAWVLIGDIIQTASELADSRSLPGRDPRSMVAFTHTSMARLSPNTVLNIGLASQKFSGQGNGLQAEYVSGPLIAFTPLTGKHWHGVAGNA